jgi:tetratricopeptide (TPR) repeat protein
MLRRDYFLRMIEEFMQALARLRALKQDQRWSEASGELDAELRKLLGNDLQSVARLSESDLLARLMRDGPTHALRDKTLVLTTLLKEAGDVAAGEARAAESHEFYLKALHLLLEVLARDEVFECPAFVPKVEMLLAGLQGIRLPDVTQGRLMHHYERTGEFAKAEDALHALLETGPDNPAIVEFGLTFYHRLLTQTDATLNAANLPRAEVEEGLRELELRKATVRAHDLPDLKASQP